MYFKQLHSGNICPIIHANGPSKYTDLWKDAVKGFFSEAKTKGELDKDLTVLTWSLPDERTLLENNMEHYGLEDRLLVLPMTRPFDFLDKIRLTKNYLHSIKTKYVMGLDATDVLICGYDNCNEVLQTFKGKNAKAVYGAEIPEWPNLETGQGIAKPIMNAPFEMAGLIDDLMDARRIDEVYAWLGSPFIHLNSGVWIGETEYMKKFYDECSSILPEGYTDEEMFGGDQGFIQVTASKNYPDVIVDYRSEMFLCLSETTNKDVEVVL